MGIVVEIFIICDGHCGTNFGLDNRGATKSEQIRNAKSQGWIFSKGKSFCPECKSKKTKPQPNAQ